MGIEEKIIEALSKIIKESFSYTADEGVIMLEIPKDNKNGDYSTNIAMRLTKQLQKKPQEIAAVIKDALEKDLDIIEKIEIAGPGFINFWLKKESMANIINTIIEKGDDYGSSNTGKGLRVLEEYVSANPTGPLHCGHARGAAWGDSVARIMNKAGFALDREYYINDAGAQILNLGKSLLARYRELFGLDFTLPEDGYHGPD
ncbi:MAG: arginine--tRNA ligase, partial [Erysipelotrichaceae bacterium]|nr:arginine--tRNA ligase [Erysipelotrichaceae bacterium]